MSPPIKKSKTDGVSMKEQIMENRKTKAGESIEKFKFNLKRVKLLTGNEGFLHREAKGVAYYMHRDQRVQDNWAMLYAQKLGNLKFIFLKTLRTGNLKNFGSITKQRNFSMHFSFGGQFATIRHCWN